MTGAWTLKSLFAWTETIRNATARSMHPSQQVTWDWRLWCLTIRAMALRMPSALQTLYVVCWDIYNGTFGWVVILMILYFRRDGDFWVSIVQVDGSCFLIVRCVSYLWSLRWQSVSWRVLEVVDACRGGIIWDLFWRCLGHSFNPRKK